MYDDKSIELIPGNSMEDVHSGFNMRLIDMYACDIISCE